MVTGILRVLTFGVGVILWLAPLVLYRDEEAKLRNIVIDWWLRISEHGERTTTRQIAISKAFARTILGYLDRVFEAKFGLRRVVITIALSAYTLESIFYVYDLIVRNPARESFMTILSPIGLVLLLLGIRRLAVFVAFPAVILAFAVGLTEHSGNVVLVWLLAHTLAIQLSLGFTRFVLRAVTNSRQRAFVILFGLVAVPLALSALVYATFHVRSGATLADIAGGNDFGRAASVVVFVTVVFDFVGLIVSVGALAMGILMGINAALWGSFARLLNAIDDRRLLKRSHFYAVGTFLVALSLASSSNEYVREHIRGWLGLDHHGAQHTTISP